MGATKNQLDAYLTPDETKFECIEIGSIASDFVLEDTDGKKRQLSEFRVKKWDFLG